MTVRGIYDIYGNPVTTMVDGGDQTRLSIEVADGWVKLPLAATCDLYELDTTLAAGGKRVLFCHTGVRPGLVEGAEPSEADIAKSAFRWPGVWTRGSERPSGVEFFVALDPTDTTPQTAPAVLVVTQSAEA